MSDTEKSRARPAGQRVVFLDVLRLLAAVQMVQGHALDALLARSLRQGAWFQAWTFARGLTSSIFLVCAGMAFALAQRGGAARGRPRRVRRALTLVVLGYAMHAPLAALFGQPWPDALRGFLAVDVLQCIGLSLLALEGLSTLLAAPGRLALTCGALSLLLLGLAPLGEQLHVAGIQALLLNYLSAQGGSLFPLLPWAGFVFWGTAVGLDLLPSLQPMRRASAALRLLGWGAGTLLLALLAHLALPVSPARSAPSWALLRLGLVLLLAGGLVGGLEGRLELPSLLRRLASETLFLYMSHVIVLYAGVLGLAHWLGPSLGLPSALLLALVLLLACAAAALAYRRWTRALRARTGEGTPRAQSAPTSLQNLR